MKRSLMTLLALGLLWVTAGQARADFVVSPGTTAAREGNSNNGYPFNIQDFGLSSQRYQQVYGAADFIAQGVTGPELITQITFRPDAFFGSAFSSTLPDIQIDLSTTLSAPDALSPTYAANVGADDTVVYGRGSLALSSSFTGPATGPKDFDIVINLQTPFLYDPTKGNLLLDVRNFGGGRTTQFDAEYTFGDTVSRVYNFDVNSPSGNPDTLGLVTRFTLEAAAPVPEPASLTLLGFGALSLVGYGWRRRKTVVA